MSQFNIDSEFILPMCRKNGFFVEVGGNHPISFSNTYALEKNGWSGLVVEPFEDFNSLYEIERPNTTVENFACVGKQQNTKTIRMVKTPEILGAAVLSFKALDYHHLSWTGGSEIEVPCCTLSNLLNKHSIKEIDFLSIDTEGFEHFVLDGINFDEVEIDFILLEHHGDPTYEFLNQPTTFDKLLEFGFELFKFIEPNQYLYRKNENKIK